MCKHAYMKSLAQRIKALREAKGLSQQTVANKVGVSRVAVTKWESGMTANLKLGNLLSLCKLLGISMEALIQGGPVQPLSAIRNDVNIQQLSAASHKTLPDESQSWIRRYETVTPERQALIDFLLQDESKPQPEWVDSDARAYVDSLEMKIHRWTEADKKTGTY